MKTIKTLMLDAAPAGFPLLAAAACLGVARATTRVFRNNSKTGILLAGLLLCSVNPARASLEFNGSSSYTIINASFLNGITTPTFTFDFWMKPADVNTWSLVWGKTESWKEWAFGGIQNGSFGFMQAWPNSYYTIESPTNVLKGGQWQHIVIVGNGTVGQFYIDGVAIPTTGSLYGQLSFNAQAGGSARGPMVWGLRDNTTLPDDGWFGGKLAHFRVWDRALSAAEVAAFHNSPPPDTAQGLRHHLPLNETTGTVMHDLIGGLQGDTFDTTWSADGPAPLTLTDGLVAYYPFNGNANDASGNGHDGTTQNTVNDADRFGTANASLAFNGSTSEFSVNESLLNIGQNYTISLWFKFDDPSRLQQPLFDSRRDWGLSVVYNDAPTTPPRVINWAVGTGTFGWSAAYVHGDKNDYQPGQWHQLLFQKNLHDYTMYIDGNLESALTVTNDFSFSPAALDFGFISSSPSYLDGSLDDIRIYNRALSSTEVTDLYALESAAFCSPHKATATATLANGFVIGATITDPGCGYTNPPVVVITGGGGSGATATAIISNGQVTGLTITSAGVGYTSAPRIEIASPPFEPTVSISVSRVNVTQHVVLGRNYVLESSTDLNTWTATGPSFTAESETIVAEFVVDATPRFYRIREVP
jgi:hypothetical protein